MATMGPQECPALSALPFLLRLQFFFFFSADSMLIENSELVLGQKVRKITLVGSNEKAKPLEPAAVKSMISSMQCSFSLIF